MNEDTLRKHLDRMHDSLLRIEGDLSTVRERTTATVTRLDGLEPVVANMTPIIQTQERHTMHLKAAWTVIASLVGSVAWHLFR